MGDGANDPFAGPVAAGFRRGEAPVVLRVRERVRRVLAFRGYGIPAAERADLEQEIMAQLWQTASRTPPRAGRAFWGLVEVVTTRRCIDWLRSRRDTVSLEAAGDVRDRGADPQRRLLERERAERGRRALERLEPGCRELVRMRVSQSMSYAEIASAVGRSETALRAQMYRCIGRARELLAATADAPGDSR